MPEALVLESRRGAVATLALNRPAQLNAFTVALHAELASALERVAADETVRCLVLTGAGRGFCAGQDLADPAMGTAASGNGNGGDRGAGDMLERWYKPLVLRLRRFPVPVIAAVNGVAAGAGASIALGCDIVLAARSAVFIQAFAKIGLVPDAGGTWLLPRLVGRAHALRLALTGDRLPAADAERIGLVAGCVDDEAFPAAVDALADRLAAMPIAALVATRQAIDAAMQLDLPAALDHEREVQSRLVKAADHREGVAAFREKRAAVFADR